MNDEHRSEIIIYQQEGQDVEVHLDTTRDTVWLSQKQMADLFGKDVRTVNEHIKNVFSEGELESEPTIRNFRMVRQEGSRHVKRDIEHYNLDVIIDSATVWIPTENVGTRELEEAATTREILGSSRFYPYAKSTYCKNRPGAKVKP